MAKEEVKKWNDAEIAEGLSDLSGWTLLKDRPAIFKSFKFKNFIDAWNFMDEIAFNAEEMGHHPEWTNVYNRVDITLSTHDVGGLSELDFDLAAIIDEIEKNPSA
jgi:4a-hydroxytetrahydrobiopterin dehydratase